MAIDLNKYKLSEQDLEKYKIEQPQQKQGFFKKVGNALIDSEKKFGQALSTVFMPGVAKEQQRQESQMAMDNAALIKALKEAKDPAKRARLLDYIKRTQGDKAITAGEINPGFDMTTKEVLGAAGGTALDILTAGSYGQVAKDAKVASKLIGKGEDIVKVGEKIMGKSGQLVKEAPSVIKPFQEITKAPSMTKGFVKGAVKGAKAGAPVGAAYGVTEGLKENESGKNILIKGIEGALSGAAVGGVTGGVMGGYKGAKEGQKLRKEARALEAIVPKPSELTPTEYEELLRQGRVTPKTMFGEAKIVPTKEDIQVAKKYADILQGKDPVKNANAVIDAIAGHDKKVGEYLRKNKIQYIPEDLKAKLQEGVKDITDIMVPDSSRVEKLKEQTINALMDMVEKNDLESLWTSRKKFDNIIDRNFKAFGGSPTLKKEIARGVRNAAQEFISDATMDEVYKGRMKEMSSLYRVLDKMDDKASVEKTQNIISAWAKANPGKAKILSRIGYIGAGYAAAKTIGFVP